MFYVEIILSWFYCNE